eukprot:8825792-Ditylum_brightwellii.AAC.1
MHPPSPGGNESTHRCADGDLCRCGSFVVQPKQKCTRGCGGHLHDGFCGVQGRKKSFLNKVALSTHMCQKCTVKIGKTELHYKLPIDTDEE